MGLSKPNVPTDLSTLERQGEQRKAFEEQEAEERREGDAKNYKIACASLIIAIFALIFAVVSFVYPNFIK